MIDRITILDSKKADYKDRFEFHEEMIRFYGPKVVPIRNIFDENWRKNIRIYKDENVYAQFYVEGKHLNLLGDPIIYSKDIEKRREIMNDLVNICKHVFISDVTKYLCNINLKYHDGNYYCYIPKTLEKYRSKKWLKTRKVDLDNNDIKIVPYDKEKHFEICNIIHKCWKKYMQNRTIVWFTKFYREILEEKPYMEFYKYKGLILTYKDIPVMFRFYREIDSVKGIMVDFENSIASVIDNEKYRDSYIKAVLPVILEKRKKEIFEFVKKKEEEIKEFENKRLEFKENKDWKNVKKIIKEIENIKKEIDDTCDKWKRKEYEKFLHFIRCSCINYNRKEFLEYVYKQGYLWYYEDGGFGKLLEYKSKKNDYLNGFYIG